MKLLKGYYAYLAVAGGFLLSFAAKDNWALQMLAYGLISAGALSLQGVSRWYMRASVAADVKMVFSLVLGPAVIPGGTAPHRAVLHRPCAAAAHRLYAADGRQGPDAQD